MATHQRNRTASPQRKTAASKKTSPRASGSAQRNGKASSSPDASTGARAAGRKPHPAGNGGRYEVLAEGQPPRPVRNKRAASTSDEERASRCRQCGRCEADDNAGGARRKPPRTGPKTPEGKERASANALRHGLTRDYRNFHLLPGEDPAHFREVCEQLMDEHQPLTFSGETLVRELAISQWNMKRANFEHHVVMLDADADPEHATPFIETALKFERYRASIARRMQRDAKALADIKAAAVRQEDEEEVRRKEEDKKPKYGPDGKPYEVDRSYIVQKYSNNPSPHDYIQNFVLETIHMSDKSSWFARLIPLVEFMEGEFLKPEYGLGDRFATKFKEYLKTHKLYHPGEPYVTKKWPPPIPEGTPDVFETMDEELTLAKNPLEVLARRESERLQKEAAEEARRERERE